MKKLIILLMFLNLIIFTILIKSSLSVSLIIALLTILNIFLVIIISKNENNHK